MDVHSGTEVNERLIETLEAKPRGGGVGLIYETDGDSRRLS